MKIPITRAIFLFYLLRLLAIALLLSLVLPVSSIAKVVALQGYAGGRHFVMQYRPQDHQIEFRRGAERFVFPLRGYVASDFYLLRNSISSDAAVCFLALEGQSVGGELRLIFWNGKAFADAKTTSYFGTSLRKMNVRRKSFILVLQHDTEDLSYVLNVLRWNGKMLSLSTDRTPWERVIEEYKRLAVRSIEKWKKSRYASYAAMAYSKIGKEDEAKRWRDKARALDRTNPFAQ